MKVYEGMQVLRSVKLMSFQNYEYKNPEIILKNF